MPRRQEYFNKAAETWDKCFQTKDVLDFLAQLVSDLSFRPGSSILDIGTGTGILIPFLLEAVDANGHVTGIDYAEKMVTLCRQKFSRFPNFSVSVQRAEKLQFRSESFDAITCFGVFPHIENKAEALRQINRVLKSGGRLIVAHALSSAEILGHHRNASPAVANDVLPSSAQMRTLLKEAGFCRISIVDKPGRYLCLSVKPPK